RSAIPGEARATALESVRRAPEPMNPTGRPDARGAGMGSAAVLSNLLLLVVRLLNAEIRLHARRQCQCCPHCAKWHRAANHSAKEVCDSWHQWRIVPPRRRLPWFEQRAILSHTRHLSEGRVALFPFPAPPDLNAGSHSEVVVGWYAEVIWGRPDRWHSPAPDRHGNLVRSVCSMRWPKPASAESRRTFEAGSSGAASCKGPTRCTTVVLHGGPDSK